MFNNSNDIPNLSIFTALRKLNGQFKLNINEVDYLEEAYACLKEIGNLYSENVVLKQQKIENYRVYLPCNIAVIEYVSIYSNIINIPTNVLYSQIYNTNVPVLLIETNLKALPTSTKKLSDYIPKGNYIDFILKEEDGRKYLEFKLNDIEVDIFCKAILTDENGYPMITYKESVAIINWILYQQYFMDSFKNNNNGALLIKLEKDMNSSINSARVTEYMSQNAISRLLDSLKSYHRHTYGKDTNIHG